MDKQNISENPSILAVSISKGTPPSSRQIKELSDAVTHDINAEAGSTRVVQSLFTKDSLGELKKAAKALENHCNPTTLRNSKGVQVLYRIAGITVCLHADFVNFWFPKAIKLKDKYDTAAANFLRNYEASIEEARDMRGDAFDRNDYPSKFDLERKLKVLINWNPMGQQWLPLIPGISEEKLAQVNPSNAFQSELAPAMAGMLEDMLKVTADYLIDPEGKGTGIKEKSLDKLYAFTDRMTMLFGNSAPDWAKEFKTTVDKFKVEFDLKRARKDNDYAKESGDALASIRAHLKDFMS